MNVQDFLKTRTEYEIKEYCQANAAPAAVAMMHINGDFNISQIVRNANWFGFQEVIYFGRRKWDKRGAVGTYHYTSVKYMEDFEKFIEYARANYNKVVALECTDELPVQPITTYVWDPSSIILVGEETNGLPVEYLQQVDDIVMIPGYGSVRSLNAATSAGIAMSHYRMSPLHETKLQKQPKLTLKK